MKFRGPVLTLLAGAATAAVLLGLSISAASQSAQRKAGQLGAAPPPPSTSAAPSPDAETPSPSAEPSPTEKPSAQLPQAYTGRVVGAAATVAIVVTGEKAVAYVCDGKRVEAWLKGTATGPKLALTGAAGAALNAELGGGKARGSVKAGGRSWTFAAPLATPPGGLYRVAKNIRGAKVVGGWIVLADGSQIGILTRDGVPMPAPKLDPATGTVVAGGDTLTATPVDGSGL